MCVTWSILVNECWRGFESHSWHWIEQYVTLKLLFKYFLCIFKLKCNHFKGVKCPVFLSFNRECPPNRSWTSDLRISALEASIYSPPLYQLSYRWLYWHNFQTDTILFVKQLCWNEYTATAKVCFSTKVFYWDINDVLNIAEGCFDQPTSGLWAQHASSAPLCWKWLVYLKNLTAVRRESNKCRQHQSV